MEPVNFEATIACQWRDPPNTQFDPIAHQLFEALEIVITTKGEWRELVKPLPRCSAHNAGRSTAKSRFKPQPESETHCGQPRLQSPLSAPANPMASPGAAHTPGGSTRPSRRGAFRLPPGPMVSSATTTGPGGEIPPAHSTGPQYAAREMKRKTRDYPDQYCLHNFIIAWSFEKPFHANPLSKLLACLEMRTVLT